MDAWYLLRCKPRQERRAIDNLENQSFLVYCPWLYRKLAKPEPLFPGYIFLYCAKNQQKLQFGKVRSTRGVMNFVKFGEHFATVPEELLDGIRRQEDLIKGEPIFKKGEIIEFADGPFKEMQAVYLCAQGEKRSVVMLNILNRQQEIKIDSDQIRKK